MRIQQSIRLVIPSSHKAWFEKVSLFRNSSQKPFRVLSIPKNGNHKTTFMKKQRRTISTLMIIKRTRERGQIVFNKEVSFIFMEISSWTLFLNVRKGKPGLCQYAPPPYPPNQASNTPASFIKWNNCKDVLTKAGQCFSNQLT